MRRSAKYLILIFLFATSCGKDPDFGKSIALESIYTVFPTVFVDTKSGADEILDQINKQDPTQTSLEKRIIKFDTLLVSNTKSGSRKYSPNATGEVWTPASNSSAILLDYNMNEDNDLTIEMDGSDISAQDGTALGLLTADKIGTTYQFSGSVSNVITGLELKHLYSLLEISLNFEPESVLVGVLTPYPVPVSDGGDPEGTGIHTYLIIVDTNPVQVTIVAGGITYTAEVKPTVGNFVKNTKYTVTLSRPNPAPAPLLTSGSTPEKAISENEDRLTDCNWKIADTKLIIPLSFK